MPSTVPEAVSHIKPCRHAMNYKKEYDGGVLEVAAEIGGRGETELVFIEKNEN